MSLSLNNVNNNFNGLRSFSGESASRLMQQLSREIVKQQGRPLSPVQTRELNRIREQLRNVLQLRD